ncbi:MAG: RecQ family ATP-dependent DNA helicase [Bacteroidota bacterium]
MRNTTEDHQPTLEGARSQLQQFWGYPDFRPGQDEAISSIFEGRDTLVLFPTGGGKSLCYQVPALELGGLTVVISPLVALMQDQVEQLNQRGIKATYINSTISRYEVEQRLVNARNGMYTLLYCSPERLATDLWQQEVDQLPISLVAIDEAHCISEWGHDFRPEYRQIKEHLADLPSEVRWVALTATATPEVRDDIVASLNFDQPNVISKGFDRPNLHWWVIEAQNKKEYIQRVVSRQADSQHSGLIYAGTRRACDELAQWLSDQTVPTKAYHAGLDKEVRNRIQEDWIEGALPLVVATNAFGMGIDKADCRYVVHYDPPFSLEGYYQQAGRAGRDGDEAYPILLYREADFVQLEKRIEKQHPSRKIIQQVYDVLWDTFEVGIGDTLDNPHIVDIEKLTQRSHYSQRVIERVLQILQRCAVLELTPHHKAELGIQFIADRDFLHDYVQNLENHRKREFVDTLHRIYSPDAFHDLHFIELGYVLDKLQMQEHTMMKGLHILEQERLLSFESRSDQPLIRFLTNRQQQVPIDHQRLERYHQVQMQKLNYLKQYAQTDRCRSEFLRRYFGETNVPEYCGKCDNCRQDVDSADNSVHQEWIDTIRKTLANSSDSLTVSEIRQQTSLTTRQVRTALRYMMREEWVDQVEDPVTRYVIPK